MDEYTRWADVPDNLKTKTQLDKMGLRLSQAQKHVALFCSYIRGGSRPTYYKLYEAEQAQAKREVTPAQAETLRLAREKALALRTCPACGEISRRPCKTQFYCHICRDHREMTAWARAVLADDRALILDTETTDLEGEIIQIALINTAGQPVFSSDIKPLGGIAPGAQAVHGLTLDKLAGAKPWPDHHQQISDLITAASRVIIYNAEFDTARLHQTAAQYGLALELGRVECAMRRYAKWKGHWSDYWQDYKWFPLGGGHTALSDCLATLERLREMSQA